MIKKMLKETLRLLSIPVERFLLLESASTILLFLSTIVALVWANGRWHTNYFSMLNLSVFGLSFQHWVNDGLMAFFFFVVGMEIKRELREGELASLKKASLPIFAAVGGMLLPALIYFVFNQQGIGARGWGIPMATDIAFAVAILSLGGKRVPLALKVFLLALAIVDDLGAVFVIALFYTKGISWAFLGFASFVVFAIFLLKRWREYSLFFYIPLAVAVWAAFFFSGIHATIAGVILGFMVPLRFKDKLGRESLPLEKTINTLHPFVSFLIMPLFALVNAGVTLSLKDLSFIFEHSIFQGIVLGLVIGKSLGIFLASFLAVKFGLAELPVRVTWKGLLATSFLGGVGFTMSLFISSLAFEAEQEVFSKAGILFGSALAAIIGLLILKVGKKKA